MQLFGSLAFVISKCHALLASYDHKQSCDRLYDIPVYNNSRAAERDLCMPHAQGIANLILSHEVTEGRML